MTPSFFEKYFWWIIGISFFIIFFISYLMEHFIGFRQIMRILKNEDISENELTINKKNIIVSEYKAIIGIDLGSTTSGYSILTEPFEDSGILDYKDLIESQIIIYKPSETGLCIGKECYYTHFKPDPDNKNHLYFTSFKRNLDPKINKNMIASDHPGDEIEIKVVIKEFLKIIKEKNINPFINNYNLKDIKWVITVPPLWDIKGKKLMQEQAKNAGMVNLDVVLEPEAASLAIFYENNPTIKKYIQPGKKFLIVDAGGYTVDFSANKILENNTLEQLIVPISIVKGSSILNDKIFDFVKMSLGEDIINKADFTIRKRILNDIEDQKKNLNKIGAQNMELNIEGLSISCSTGSIFSWSNKKECEKEIEGKNFLIQIKYFLFLKNMLMK